MKIETLKAELTKVERRREKLEKQIQAQAAALYTSLPRKAGLKSVDELVLALIPFASSSIQKKLQNGSAGPAKASPSVAPAKLTRTNSKQRGDKRMRYSDAQKDGVRKDLKEGKLTTKQISEKHNVGEVSIKLWKKKWGLTKPRKAK